MDDHLKLTDTHMPCTGCGGKKAYTRPITIQRLSALARIWKEARQMREGGGHGG